MVHLKNLLWEKVYEKTKQKKIESTHTHTNKPSFEEAEQASPWNVARMLELLDW